MVLVKCSKCSHEWDYSGDSKFYITCTMCRKILKVEDVRV